jgi:hypothetical protein
MCTVSVVFPLFCPTPAYILEMGRAENRKSNFDEKLLLYANGEWIRNIGMHQGL